MAFCPECGKKIPAGADFCPECGTRLVPAAPPTKPAPLKEKPTRVVPPEPRGGGRGKLIAGVVVVVVIVAVLGWFFLLGPGKGLIGLGSKVEITFTPSTVHVGDSYTATMTVTNKESGTMIISGGTMKIYRNNQLLDTSTSTTGWENTIPPGQTVTIFSYSGTVPSTIPYGGTSYSSVGTWKFEVSLNTNYGTLTGSCTFTILS